MAHPSRTGTHHAVWPSWGPNHIVSKHVGVNLAKLDRNKFSETFIYDHEGLVHVGGIKVDLIHLKAIMSNHLNHKKVAKEHHGAE